MDGCWGRHQNKFWSKVPGYKKVRSLLNLHRISNNNPASVKQCSNKDLKNVFIRFDTTLKEYHYICTHSMSQLVVRIELDRHGKNRAGNRHHRSKSIKEVGKMYWRALCEILAVNCQWVGGQNTLPRKTWGYTQYRLFTDWVFSYHLTYHGMHWSKLCQNDLFKRKIKRKLVNLQHREQKRSVWAFHFLSNIKKNI